MTFSLDSISNNRCKIIGNTIELPAFARKQLNGFVTVISFDDKTEHVHCIFAIDDDRSLNVKVALMHGTRDGDVFEWAASPGRLVFIKINWKDTVS